MTEMEYNRDRVTQYARRWAFDRNPLFYDFVGIGGDCSNFVSQCVFAGCCNMNFTPTFGWYYLSIDDRAPAWTGVEFLHNFLTTNDGLGPYADGAAVRNLQIGDIVQLGRNDGSFYHSLIITGGDRRGWLVSAHSNDAYNRPLESYQAQRRRGIHILGYRTENEDCDCFRQVYSGESLGICDRP